MRLILESFRFCWQRLYCCVVVKVLLEEVEDYWLQRSAIRIGQSVLGASLHRCERTTHGVPDFVLRYKHVTFCSEHRASVRERYREMKINLLAAE